MSDGELSRSGLPQLRGLNVRGAWLPDFDELVRYTDQQIPHDDGILIIPGEDLFYYATGRRPRFPVLMFDHTVNPYTPEEIVDLARARDIRWLIVKGETQLEEDSVQEFKDGLRKLLSKDFKQVDSLTNYYIYRRRLPGESDDEQDENGDKDDQDEDDSSRQ